jgi:hypothetical protein
VQSRDLVDPIPIHVDDLEAQLGELEVLRGLGNTTEDVHDETAEGIEGVLVFARQFARISRTPRRRSMVTLPSTSHEPSSRTTIVLLRGESEPAGRRRSMSARR